MLTFTSDNPAGAAAVWTAAKRVLVVEDDTLVSLGLKAQLEQLGHTVVGQAATAEEAVRQFDATTPDLVLLDIRLDHSDGIDVATTLMGKRRVPMIIVSAYSDAELIHRASDAGVFGYLIKPVATEALAAQIQVAVQRFEESEKLRSDNEQLQRNLETRKLVERAKAVLIKRLNLPEPEAHRRLQLESQRRRISIAEVAKKIIESDELLGG